jgi:hypothetical protein
MQTYTPLLLFGMDCLVMHCITLLNLNDVAFISSTAYRLTRTQYNENRRNIM